MALTVSGDLEVAKALQAVGVQPKYAMGPWTVPGITAATIDAHLNACKAIGVTPAFQLFYFGDEICLEVLKGTYRPIDYGGQAQDIGGYWTVVKLLTARIKASGIQGVLVIPETEWNKLGPNLPKDKGLRTVLAEPAVWDKIFADTAGYFHDNAPGTKVVTAPGSWTDLAALLAKFPLMVAACDMVGTQSLNTLYNQTEASYIASADRLLAKVNELKVGGKGKPVLITDCAWSSYGGSYRMTGDRDKDHPFTPAAPATPDFNLRAGENAQRLAIERLGALLPRLEAAGLQGLFYRGLKDSKMNIANYWGYFEWGWGVVRFDGTKKPSFGALTALAQPEPVYTKAQYDAVVKERDKALSDLRAVDSVKQTMDLAIRSMKPLTEQLRQTLERF